MRDYIARDPRTGRPLRAGRRRRRRIDEDAYVAPAGPWDAIPQMDILKMANGEIPAAEVEWRDKPHLVSQADGVRALPRISRKKPDEAHAALVAALSSVEGHLRSAGLFALPYCALTETEELFEHLHEMLDDSEASVRKDASACLVIVAPVFPSAIEETITQELRSTVISRRKSAFAALKSMCDVWPEVVAIHLDELLRAEDDKLRVQAAGLLPRLAKVQSAAIWDLITWSIQDEAAAVRVQAARCLPTLADKAPRYARLLLEISIFDENDDVRKHSLRALNKMDVTGFRMSKLCIDGARHRDRDIRRACILLLPRLILGTELRVQAAELLRQETDPELIGILEEIAIDPELEGDEDDKNRNLAPAPPVQMEGGYTLEAAIGSESVPSLPPPDEPEKSETRGESEEDKSKPPAFRRNRERRPTQDELYGVDSDEYGDDTEDEN